MKYYYKKYIRNESEEFVVFKGIEYRDNIIPNNIITKEEYDNLYVPSKIENGEYTPISVEELPEYFKPNKTELTDKEIIKNLEEELEYLSSITKIQSGGV